MSKATRARTTRRAGAVRRADHPVHTVTWRVGLALVVAATVAAALAFLWVRDAQAPAYGSLTADPDSFIRWSFVKRALDGEGVRVRWTTADNAPYGRIIEWTAPMTIVGVAAVRLTESVGGLPREAALRLAALWLGPVVGLVGLVTLAWLGWRTGGWLLAVCWVLAWPLMGAGTPPFQFPNQFGNVDHHSLHQLVFLTMIGGCLARLSGVVVGVVSALGLWSAGSELLPAWGFVAALAVWETGWLGEDARSWRAWWIAGLLGTLAAWVFEFWPDLLHGYLEFISIWHVGLWILVGGTVECLARRRMGHAARIATVLVALLLAILGAAAVKGFDWRHLHVAQDALFQGQIADTVEFRSILSEGLRQGVARFASSYGLLVLLLLPAVRHFSRLNPRLQWGLGVTGALLALSAHEERWGDLLAVPLVLTSGAVVQARWGRRPFLCVGLILLATIPQWRQALDVRAEARRLGSSVTGWYETVLVMDEVSACLDRAGEAPVVLADWSQSGFLAGMGKVRVVGTGYWANDQGLRDSHELFSTDSESRFWQLVRERRIEYFFRPPAPVLEDAIGGAFRVLGRGTTTAEEVRGTVIWRIASSANWPAVTCPRLARLGPGISVLRLDRPAGLTPR